MAFVSTHFDESPKQQRNGVVPFAPRLPPPAAAERLGVSLGVAVFLGGPVSLPLPLPPARIVSRPGRRWACSVDHPGSCSPFTAYCVASPPQVVTAPACPADGRKRTREHNARPGKQQNVAAASVQRMSTAYSKATASSTRGTEDNQPPRIVPAVWTIYKHTRRQTADAAHMILVVF
ncbi:hypothetical protein Cob_v013103 [Colletotrichum orbiculare MAFF 240422]|uniref:Uncharacterized protein n=1 Tax=Colletotrichum orbiculare (strain 104-T / ATCC 96160 / CBS 514.97 / LARS 414 / MAFF 240422) TaxID=1213857 RepID=A0A484F8V0_COLOR|nr:hypothetical protein Cob_v013103 [Colletotrichum orbiculare MAFF 240422]